MTSTTLASAPDPIQGSGALACPPNQGPTSPAPGSAGSGRKVVRWRKVACFAFSWQSKSSPKVLEVTMSKSTCYAYVGTYSDGVQRSGHVHTDDIERWVARVTKGVLPFARISTEFCAAGFYGCPGHSFA